MPCISALAMPTPMIEPISVCELEAGKPRYQVPRFQTMAAIKSANTIAKPALRADLQDQFDRQQRDDAERDRAARQQHAEEVEEARPHHGEFRRHERAGARGRRIARSGAIQPRNAPT